LICALGAYFYFHSRRVWQKHANQFPAGIVLATEYGEWVVVRGCLNPLQFSAAVY
jgi:hypothetical protein